jgi:radical SAM-linked protein
MARDKFRIRFRKGGDLRLLSHHDLMRTFERMLRRAGLPFRSTEGFHPKPRMVFALSLSLGAVGLEEVVELELTEELQPDIVLTRLAAEAPPGLDLLSIRRIEPTVTAQVCRAVYRLAVPADRRDPLSKRCSEIISQPECWVDRARPQPRRVNIRPFLRDLRAGPESLEIDLTVTPTGTARADEVLALLGLADLLDAGAVVERAVLELHDETPANQSEAQPRDSEPFACASGS